MRDQRFRVSRIREIGLFCSSSIICFEFLFQTEKASRWVRSTDARQLSQTYSWQQMPRTANTLASRRDPPKITDRSLILSLNSTFTKGLFQESPAGGNTQACPLLKSQQVYKTCVLAFLTKNWGRSHFLSRSHSKLERSLQFDDDNLKTLFENIRRKRAFTPHLTRGTVN